jgi:hypothetical protein
VRDAGSYGASTAGARRATKLQGNADVRTRASKLDEESMFVILSFLATMVLATIAYTQARSFVTRRLRYVDAVQSAIAPIVAGLGAAVVALPIMALLPLVGVGTALSVGLGVGAGVAAGAREVRRSLPRY